MTSFFSSLKRVSPPVDDAPLGSLPECEATVLKTLDGRLSLLFDAAQSTLHESDPWRTLPENLRLCLLLRFLRYHLLNVDKAQEHIMRVAKWRLTECPWEKSLSCVKGKQNGIPILEADIRGKNNEILIYLPAKRYVKAEVDHHAQELAIQTFFEHCAYAEDGYRASCAVLLFDFTDMLMKNVDLTASRYAIKIFLDYYPEAFHRIFLVNYPKWLYGSKLLYASPGFLLNSNAIPKVCF